MKQVQPRTNGDRVDEVTGRVRERAGELLAWAAEHPDEAAVAVLPVVAALYLSAKYDMDFADHMVIGEAAQALSLLALKAYREWKARPARPSLKEVA